MFDSTVIRYGACMTTVLSRMAGFSAAQCLPNFPLYHDHLMIELGIS
jgi:hypothetical protein